MQVLRTYYSLRRKVMLFCCGKDPRYSISYVLHGQDLDPWQNIIPHGTLLLQTVRRDIVDETDIRTRVFHTGETYSLTLDAPSFFETKADLPWMWIGGIDRHGTTISLTEELSRFILPKNRITLGLLRILYPEIVQWKYMCPLTFEELEFPAEGITI